MFLLSGVGFKSPSVFKAAGLVPATNDSVFLFDGQLYCQIEGMAMGSPLGPSFANAFLAFHEVHWLRDCPTHFRPLVYKRYVDDCFVLFKEKEHANLFKDYLNAKHPNITFSSVFEAENSLPFLDVDVSRGSGTFSTSVYRKPTNTLLSTNYFSNVQNSFKFSGIRSRLSRAFNICSSWIAFHKEVEFLKKQCNFNLFPGNSIDNLVFSLLDSVLCPKLPSFDFPRCSVYLNLPYLGNLTSTLNSLLLDSLKRSFPQCNFHFINKNNHSIGSYFRVKDTIPTLLSSRVIYKYTCADCQVDYVGQTGLQLKMRAYKHMGLSFRTSLPISQPEHSAIRSHSDQLKHPILFTNFSILDTSNVEAERRILESLYIKHLKPALNDTISSTKLNMV